jgi:hypothetical protein
MDPVRSRIGGYDPRRRGRRIPGGSSLDHLALTRFSRTCLHIVLLAGGGAILAALLQRTKVVSPGTAEIIKWVAVALALAILLWDGLDRFRRSRSRRAEERDRRGAQKVSSGESSRSGGAASSSRPEEGRRRQK